MRFGCQIWGQNYNCHIKDLKKLQIKADSILEFERNFQNLSKIFNDPGIMKFNDIVTLSNNIFVHDQTTKTCLVLLETDQQRPM